jgi:1,4-alpha-glucan branching enzyme
MENPMVVASLVVAMFMFAANDNNVEWAGVSHIDWQDRRPPCPVDGESFSVLMQAYANDLTAVRAFVDDGTTTQWVDGYYSHDRASYAVWRVDLPASSSTGTVNYYLELTDGADVDYHSVSGTSDAAPVDGGCNINFATLEPAPIGATLVTGGGAVFNVWAPTANFCVVSAEWNLWAPSAQSGADSLTKYGEYFVGRAPNAFDRGRYKFVFRPGVIYKPDARARSLDPSAGYESLIEDPLRYQWVSDNFTPPAFQDLIVYQCHVGTFAGKNDPAASGSIPATYRDVAAHADHFVELGVNCLYLMPITEFSFDFSAGYNPVTQWAPEWKYGDPDDLKYLVDVMHQHGIAVIHDIVWNHFDASDNHLWFYDGGQIYFQTPDVQTPWGSQADFTNGEVRRYFVDSAVMWLDEYRFDGFRADATDFMNIFPQEAEGWSLMQWLNDTIDNRAVDSFSLAEQLPDDAAVTTPIASGGAGYDSQLNDYFIDTLRQEILDAAFGDPEMFKIADIVDGSGSFLQKRRVTNYLESHDEAWPQSGGTRLVKLIDTTAPHNDEFATGRTKLGYGVVFAAQGIPMILQGTEWLESTDFGAGNASGDDRINWNRKSNNQNIFRYFRDLMQTKRANDALDATEGIQVFHQNEAGNVIAWQRFDTSGNLLVCVANFSNADYPAYNLGFPQAGTWYQLLNSDHTKYDGSGMVDDSVEANAAAADGFSQSATFQLAKMGFVIFRWNDPLIVPPCPSDFNGDYNVDITDLGILLANFGLTGATQADGDASGDAVVNITDLGQVLADFGSLCP